MDPKLREYIETRLRRLEKESNASTSNDLVLHAFINGKTDALLDILNLIDQPSLPPEGGSMEQKLWELVGAQEKHIERQDSLIEMQDKLIVTLIKEREGK